MLCFTLDEEEKWTVGSMGFLSQWKYSIFDLGCGYTGVCFCVTHSLFLSISALYFECFKSTWASKKLLLKKKNMRTHEKASHPLVMRGPLAIPVSISCHMCYKTLYYSNLHYCRIFSLSFYVNGQCGLR